MPRGCPSAIAPPFGLTLSSSSSIPRDLKLAKPCAANASFISIISISFILIPAILSAFKEAGTGPMP